MKAIILAGGEGKRLKPVTGPLPKPMVPILGKPVLERILELLTAHGIREICITLKYYPRPIVDHFGNGSRFGVHLSYSLEKDPLGTAGGVKACQDFWDGEDFLVISGDAACDFDLTRLIRAHETVRPAATIALYPHPDPLQYGLVLSDKSGKILQFTEKPSWDHVVTNLINTGVYILTPHVMDYVPNDTPCDFGKELFPALLAYGEPLHGVIMEGYWRDIGTPKAYYQCCLDALDGIYRISDPVSAAPVPATVPACSHAEHVHRIPCTDRAAVMQTVTSAMMELGADFSDGIHFGNKDAFVHIHPDASRSAIVVESNTAETANTFAAFVERQSS